MWKHVLRQEPIIVLDIGNVAGKPTLPAKRRSRPIKLAQYGDYFDRKLLAIVFYDFICKFAKEFENALMASWGT